MARAGGAAAAAVSKAERRYMESGIAQDLRADGRGRLHFRPFSIEPGVIPQANGSARVRLGGTHIIASVKAELGAPAPARPGHGHLHVSVDCAPQIVSTAADQDPDLLALDLSRALHRCLLGGASGAGAALHLPTLALVPGKLCWALHVDALVLGADGNLLDCAAVAVRAALADTGVPKVDVVSTEGGAGGGEVEVVDVDDGDPEGFARLDAARVPLVVTLTKVGKDYFVDASAAEEQAQQASASVSVAVTPEGRIAGVVKRTGAGVQPAVLVDMLGLAREVGRELFSQVDDATAKQRHAR